MKKYIVIVTSDDMYQQFTTVDCDTQEVVHQHSCGYCSSDEEENNEVRKACIMSNGIYKTIKISGSF